MVKKKARKRTRSRLAQGAKWTFEKTWVGYKTRECGISSKEILKISQFYFIYTMDTKKTHSGVEKKFRLIESSGDWTGIVKPEYLEIIKTKGPQEYSFLSLVFPARYLVRFYKNYFVGPEDDKLLTGGLSDDTILECFIEDTFTADQAGCSISLVKEIKGAIGDSILPEEVERMMRERLDLMNTSNVIDEYLISEPDWPDLYPEFLTDEYLESLRVGQSWRRSIEFEVVE